MGILDTIISNKQTEAMQQFRATDIVKDILESLKERDKKILSFRYGLLGNEIKTLAAIGQDQSLTRERVRQIEKDVIKTLRKNSNKINSFASTKEFILNLVAQHGRIIAEENLLLQLNVRDEEEKNSIIFLLHLIEELDNFIHDNYKKNWVLVLFNQDLLHNFVSHSKSIIEKKEKPLPAEEFLEHFRQTEFYQTNQNELSDKTILNFLELTVDIEKNVFGEYGLSSWKEIKPKDVGDKAYLVMKYHKKPEHYSVITEMINKAKFDNKTAYKETVHNELIKDSRFVLIGRGIYALSEWGFKPGVVSDVILGILKTAVNPLSKEKIIEEVLKVRQVKKNTILVSLSNKNLFKKVGKNQYALV